MAKKTKTAAQRKKNRTAGKTAKPWSGRFTQATDELVERYTASIPYDWRLYPYDIAGSMAHAHMLGKTGVITQREARRIITGLRQIEREIRSGAFPFRLELEDIHMNIESRLIEKIGPVGGKLHTARSRNDQVALDVRMYVREAIAELFHLLHSLLVTIVDLADRHLDVVMPGYTHLQRAQPVLFSHHLLAYAEMFSRDRARLADCFTRVNVLPLGSGALAGTVHPIDRRMVAKLLDFDAISENSIDAVSDRDFVIEFVAACSQIMMHLSRLAEELVLWSTAEFGFLTLSDGYTTGSSIMPQKKNPDVAELARGKTGRVYGNLVALLTILKGLPLAYNRDMQEDKEPLFDTADTVADTLTLFIGMLREVRINREAMRRAAEDDFITATDLADYLVRKGMPFREAHAVVGRAVLRASRLGRGLATLPIEEYRALSPLIDEDVYEALALETSVRRRTSFGGTAPANVKKRIHTLRRELKRL